MINLHRQELNHRISHKSEKILKTKIRLVVYYEFQFSTKSENDPMVNTHILVQGFDTNEEK